MPTDSRWLAIHEKPDATLEELRQQLNLDVALSTLWRAVDALGFSYAKPRSAPSKVSRSSSAGATSLSPPRSVPISSAIAAILPPLHHHRNRSNLWIAAWI
jgi:hypothetical protein